MCVEKKSDLKISEKIVLFFSVGQFLVHMCREKSDLKISEKIVLFFSVGQFLVHMCGEKK